MAIATDPVLINIWLWQQPSAHLSNVSIGWTAQTQYSSALRGWMLARPS